MLDNIQHFPKAASFKLPPFKVLLPTFAMILMFAVIFVIQPHTCSYFGLSLLLNLLIPAVFASMAQMLIITVNDIDLGIGPFISMTSCVAATILTSHLFLGFLALLLAIAAYAAMGLLIHVRRLPALVVTLGASFVWYGCALLLLPAPGGGSPQWLMEFVDWSPPFIPLPVLISILVAVIGYLLLIRSATGTVLRGIGGNAKAIRQAGWSLLSGRVLLYAAAGVCGVIAGLLLTGINTSGDANVGTQYTLTSIASVIVGGSEFAGGDVSPFGTVVGTVIILLTGSMLSFINISASWQLSFQGLILILVLGLRAFGARS